MPFFGVPIRNGLPIGLGSVAGFGAPQEFTPAELFIGGTAGTWYDPPDLPTLFTTSAGTTSCPMPGQGSAVSVGLMLDKSQGLVLGPELVTATPVNGTLYAFSTFTTSGVLITSAIKTPTDFAGASWDLGNDLPVGTIYEATITIAINSGPAPKLIVGTTNNGSPTLRSNIASLVNGQNTVKLIITGASARYLTVGTESAAYNFSVTSISLKRILGNHAIAINDSTARPELRARVNLLTYSEDISNAAWTRTNVTAASVTSLLETTTNGTHNCNQLVNFVSGVLYVVQYKIKPNGRTRVGIAGGIGLGQLATIGQFYELSGTGSVVNTLAGITAAISLQPDGYYLCSLTVTPSATSTITIGVYLSDGGTNLSYAGDVTKGIDVTAADIRPANIGAAVPAYQRIADANTYDTAGFPLYLRFDGIDDGLYTPANLNLTATDKVGVFAGVRKLSDAAAGIIVENNSSTPGGVVSLSASPSSTAAYFFRSAGTADSSGATPANYAAPITNVLTGIGEISTDTRKVRVNGTEVVNSTADQGTGNYATNPITVGYRSGGSLWFQGQVYGLVVVGSAVSAGNISATESWMAQKTGIVIP